jgi:hypothetical protein
MEALIDGVRSRLRAIFAGRSVILAGGVAAAASQPVDQLRGFGVERFLVATSGAGTGARPEGADVEFVDLLAWETAGRDDVIASFREEERAIDAPSEALLDAVRRFDPRRNAIVLVPPFLDVRALGDRPAFGARRPEWVALEDKTIADELFDATGVPRPASAVVPADASSISSAAAALDRGEGTVWSADARDGFNGGGAYVRWVRDEADRRDALDLLLPKCDRVRVAAFADGVPCSIHGFVVDDGVAVFRPVELVTLRAPSPPRLRYCGCATFFDPPAVHVATMRASVSRIGAHLREHVGYRGAFTLDGIASPDGWMATECNPRFGAGLGYVSVALPELCLMLLHHAVVEGVVDVLSAALENTLLEAGARTRWGGAWTAVERRFDQTSKAALVGGVDGFRHAIDGEPPDAVMEVGPGRTGGFVRFDFDAARTPRGPSIAPLAVAGFAFADRELDLGLGPLASARPVA